MQEERISTDSLLLLFHVLGQTYPVGGFSHSFGLETYISQGHIQKIEELREYICWNLKQNGLHFEGPFFCLAYEAGRNQNAKEWLKLDRQNTAMRLSRENREASLKMGQAFFRTSKAVFGEKKKPEIFTMLEKDRSLGNYATTVGYWGGSFEIPLREALLAFLFNSVNNLVQVGIKIIPLGQSESQKMLYSLYPHIGEIVDMLLNVGKLQPQNFLPAQDIMSMQHEELYTRLYMS